MNSKIIVFATMTLGLIVALFLGMAVGEGNRLQIAAVFAIMVGAPLLLSLGKNYWYLIPASLLSGLPAIPFGGRSLKLSELCIVLCFGIFVTRVAFKLDKIVLWRATHIPIYLFMGWVFFIFCLYPVGLAAFGAATMGGRFYLQILLAFMAFLIISSREINEKDCKWIIFFVMGGAIVNCAYNVFSFFFIGVQDDFLSDGSSPDGYYTWHQNLAVPTVAFVFLLFASKKPSNILSFKHPILVLSYFLAIIITLYSGKRIGLVSVAFAPILGAIIYRQYSYLWLGLLGAAIVSLTIIVGHGEFFRLPLQAQRALSILPADWDTEFRNIERGADPFRESLRRFAMENIERNPIIGKGFAIDYSEIIGQIMSTKYIGGGDSQAAPYAIGRAWHNTWLGYAADFGIPLSIIQAILYVTITVVCYRSICILPRGSSKFIVCGFAFFYLVRDWIGSHTSGHTSIDAFDRWWIYGMIFSIYAFATTKPNIFPKTSETRDIWLERIALSKAKPTSAQR